MEQQFDYDIFLSYRHKNLDSIITQKTFQFVESYRLPRSLKRKGYRDVHRAFRDTEELPVSRILTDTIDKALRSTKCLLLVCSTDTPSSEWVALVEKRKFRVPPSGLKPQHRANASSSVDFPEPFSPTRKVTGRSKVRVWPSISQRTGPRQRR